jgi:hypothetical protein
MSRTPALVAHCEAIEAQIVLLPGSWLRRTTPGRLLTARGGAPTEVPIPTLRRRERGWNVPSWSVLVVIVWSAAHHPSNGDAQHAELWSSVLFGGMPQTVP